MNVEVAAWQTLKLEIWERCRDGVIQQHHLDRLKVMTREELDAHLGHAPEVLKRAADGVL